ncbi:MULTISPECIES: IS4 family transposase [Bacillus cereus group]|uniref:IS4 family transposase n=1 Tax=Bacillus cereus group TaxID=86661 RepID=UPI003D6500B2
MSVPYAPETTLGHAIFDQADFGDVRRNARMAESFDLMKLNPGGSLPNKLGNPADLRALYRLLDSPGVTHRTVIEAIGKHTLAQVAACPDPVLILHDATELDYSSLKSLSHDLAQIGKGNRRGYICQNVLAVNARTGAVLGLVDQILHKRARKHQQETAAQHRNRKSRESLLWLRGTEHLPAGCELTDVCDRGADTFEFLEHQCKSGRDFVIRSSKNRSIHVGHQIGEETTLLADFAEGLPELGRFTMDVQYQRGCTGSNKRKARAAREAEFTIQAGAVLACPPQVKKGIHGDDPLPLYVVRVCEVDPPEGEKPVQWTLLTNKCVRSFKAAWDVTEIYEKRWIIEELHKGQKTGCRIEDIQFTTVDRLQPAIALLTALAVTLLNLRDMSRMKDARETAASEVLDRDYIAVLSLWRFKEVKALTVHEFFYALARLGGHQNRSSDHDPGWIVIWRGWAKLQNMILGYQAAIAKRCGKT